MLLINTGGISVSKTDTLYPIVKKLEAEKMFLRVRTRKRESIQRYQLNDPMRTTFRRIASAIE